MLALAVGAGLLGILGVIVIPAVQAARESARRTRCFNHLKRIGLAMQDHLKAHDHFPTAAIFDEAGRPLLSWRVALLPELGHPDLYARFRLDEPWDSPHNLALLPEMPEEFNCPSGAGRRDHRTPYRVAVGPDTLFYGTPRPVDLRHVLDGTAQTLMAAESAELVPWTKPDEMRYEDEGPTPRLDSPHRDGSYALFADGTVSFLKHNIEPKVLRSLFTANGNEVISDD